jgi:hypothetical protein
MMVEDALHPPPAHGRVDRLSDEKWSMRRRSNRKRAVIDVVDKELSPA